MIPNLLKNKYLVFVFTSLVFILCGGLIFMFGPGQSHGATVDQENDEIGDRLSCNGAAEDAIASDPDVSDYDDPADITIGDGDDLIDYNFDFEDVYGTGQAFLGTPQAEIFTPSYQFPYGAEVFLSVNPLFFNTTKNNFSDIYIAWFKDDVPLQGVAAGADLSSLESLNVEEVGNQVPNCNSVSRLAAVDTDGDGLDDEWERRYFINRGLATSLEEVDPDADYDNDGALPRSAINTNGRFITVVPAVLGADSLDGVYSNFEEYVWGTDPTSPDTDGDGFRDGDDILGAGQLNIIFVNDKRFGEAGTEVRATVAGTGVQRNATNERLIKIDSTTLEILTTNAEDLVGEVSLEQEYILPGESVTARFEPQGTQAQAQTLEVNWYLDGELQTAQSGVSRNTLEFEIPSDKGAGDYLVILASANNPATGQSSRASKIIRIGEPLVLDYLADQVFVNTTLPISVNFLRRNQRQDYVYRWFIDNTLQKNISGPGRNTLPLQIDRAIEGERIDVKVEVYEIDSSELVVKLEEQVKVVAPRVGLILAPARPTPGSNVTVLADLTHFPGNNLKFNWELDGVDLSDKQSSQISFIAGDADTQHTVYLGLENDAASDSFAEALASIQIYPEHSGSAGLSRIFQKTLAALNISSPATVISFGVVMLVIFVSLVTFKKGLSKNNSKIQT